MIRLIVAMSRDGVIGVDNKIPWHIPEEMKHFKEQTTLFNHHMNNIVLMGRKTWESLPDKYRPLPNRYNVVISKSKANSDMGAHMTSASIESVLEFFKNENKHINVIGGGEIYKYFLDNNLVDEIILSVVHKELSGAENAVFLEGLDLFKFNLETKDYHEEFTVYYYRVKAMKREINAS